MDESPKRRRRRASSHRNGNASANSTPPDTQSLEPGSSSPRTQLERLILEYFRGRSGTRLSVEDLATFQIELGAAGRDDFGRESLLVSVGESAMSGDAEALTSAHPYIDVIQNQLTREPPVAEATAVLNLVGPGGRVSVPGMTFEGAALDFTCKVRHVAFYGIVFHVVYEGEARSDNLITLFYEAESSRLEPALSASFHRLALRSGPPRGVDTTPGTVALAMQAARMEITRLVRGDAAAAMAEAANRLSTDRARLKRHYDDERSSLRDDDVGRRLQVEERLQKDMRELDMKSELKVSIRPHALLRLWLPEVAYEATAQGRDQELAVGAIVYRADHEHAHHPPCGVCGNDRRFIACLAGGHLACAACGGPSAECSVCHEPGCRSHCAGCGQCGLPICVNDGKECAYGRHPPSTLHCSECLVASFESRPLCLGCRSQCERCDRAFPSELTRRCVGGETICAEHTDEACAWPCQECDREVCGEHGDETAEGTRVCRGHGRVTACCGRRFSRSRVVACVVEPSEALCADHRRVCCGCDAAVCLNHSAKREGVASQRVCDRCRVLCADCGELHAFLPADLMPCRECGRDVCVKHRQTCSVCRMPVDRAHALTSLAGAVLCPSDAGTCDLCDAGGWHPKQELAPCAICESPSCATHRAGCAGCGLLICLKHSTAREGAPQQRICDRCRARCAYCDADRAYLPGDLEPCAHCQRTACARHRLRCSACGATVARDHALVSTAGAALCPADAATCSLCSPRDWHPRTELVACVACGRRTCSKHHTACALCGGATCMHDRLLSAAGQGLCPYHAAACPDCPAGSDIHPKPEVSPCAHCGRTPCGAHRFRCPTCALTQMCKAHEPILASCTGCGRPSCKVGDCTPEAASCRDCTTVVCKHCLTKEGQCPACRKMEKYGLSQEALDFLSKRCVASGNAQVKKWIEAAIQSPDQLHLEWGKGARYNVLLYTRVSPWRRTLGMSSVTQRLRVASNPEGDVYVVRLEPV